MKTKRITWKDFHYPTQWPTTNHGQQDKTKPPTRTLIISPTIKVTHKTTKLTFTAVLTHTRADRHHTYMILAKVPIIADRTYTNLLENLPHPAKWYDCANGYTEQSLAEIDMGIDHYSPHHDHKRQMWKQSSDKWNLWLAAAMVLRHNGFTLQRNYHYYLTL